MFNNHKPIPNPRPDIEAHVDVAVTRRPLDTSRFGTFDPWMSLQLGNSGVSRGFPYVAEKRPLVKDNPVC